MQAGNGTGGPSPHPALFLHIQKTAGTALVVALRTHYGTSIVSHGDFIGRGPAAFRNVRCVSGHFGYAWARPLMSGRYCFTFLRDPVERVLSFYHFCRTQDPGAFSTFALARKLDLDGFLAAADTDALVAKNIRDNQAWQLAHGFLLLERYDIPDALEVRTLPPADVLALAREHLADFNHVGFAETFAEDYRVVLDALGVTHDGTPPAVINAGQGRPPRTDLAPHTLERIHALTELDRQVYDYAFQSRRARSVHSTRQ